MKHLIVVLSFLVFGYAAQSQEMRLTKHHFGFGYGTGNYSQTVFLFLKNQYSVLDYKAEGPYFLTYAYRVKDIALTLHYGYVACHLIYTSNIRLSSGTFYQEYYDWHSYNLLMGGRYYFYSDNNLELYMQMAFGTRYAELHIKDNMLPVATDSLIIDKNRIGFAATFGLTYHLSDFFSFYSEVGLAKALFQAGIVFSFGYAENKKRIDLYDE